MKLAQKFPLYLPGRTSERNDNLSLISSDVREDKIVLGYYTTQSGKVLQKIEKEYLTREYNDFSEVVLKFMEEFNLNSISRLSVGVPGMIINNSGISKRLPWILDREEIVQKTKIQDVYLINDVEAMAYGIADFCDESLEKIHDNNIRTTGNVAVLAPGEGLGEAGLYYDGEFLRPFATEGGHSEFSPRTTIEVEFYQFLNKIYGIVIWENVLSKKGLFNIFRFLRDVKGHKLSDKLITRLQSGNEFCSVIFQSAIEDDEMISKITINTFLEFLSREANSLVLKLKATGGLLIGGELPLLFKEYIDTDRLYQKFLISDKMERILKDIPIYFIPNDKMVLIGAAYYAAFLEK